MKPVEQTTPRNCFAACVASIFERDITDVDIAEGGGFNETCRWTKENAPWLSPHSRIVGGLWHVGGMHNEKVWLDTYPPVGLVEPPFWPSPYWIAGAISPRATMQLIDGVWKPYLHAVVMRGRDLVWDPSPHREQGVGGIYDATWWNVCDPAAVTGRTT